MKLFSSVSSGLDTTSTRASARVMGTTFTERSGLLVVAVRLTCVPAGTSRVVVSPETDWVMGWNGWRFPRSSDALPSSGR